MGREVGVLRRSTVPIACSRLGGASSFASHSTGSSPAATWCGKGAKHTASSISQASSKDVRRSSVPFGFTEAGKTWAWLAKTRIDGAVDRWSPCPDLRVSGEFWSPPVPLERLILEICRIFFQLYLMLSARAVIDLAA